MIMHVPVDEDIDPLKLVGNARLALHHHMAPATSNAESDAGDGVMNAPDVDPLKLVGNARLGLHHHMAPATVEPEEGDSDI